MKVEVGSARGVVEAVVGGLRARYGGTLRDLAPSIEIPAIDPSAIAHERRMDRRPVEHGIDRLRRMRGGPTQDRIVAVPRATREALEA